MFERYTDSARRALFFARYEASRLGSVSIETEHLLLGLLRLGGALGGLLPVSVDSLRRDVEGRVIFKEQLAPSVEIPFSAETKCVLEFAAVEADAIRHRHIGIEHLLLGLLREDRCGAALSLASHGVRLSDVRRDVEKLPAPLDGGTEPIVLLQIEAIKRMVKELTNAPQGSKASADLLARICASLDSLSNPGG